MRYETDNQVGALSESTNISLITDPFPGRIGPHVQSAAVFRCPGDRSYVVINGSRHSRVRSYSMNHFIGKIEGSINGGEPYTTVSSVPSPSERWVFIDEHEDSISFGEFRFIGVQWLKEGWNDLPALRHAGSGTLSFADGHGESRKWLDRRTRVPVLRQRQGSSLGAGNKDVLWLWLRTTTPEPAYMP